MPLRDITKVGVQKAIAEFDELGRERFLEHNGFGKAHRYWLIHAGKRYDAKAIVGVAHKYDLPSEGPLRSPRLKSGQDTVVRRLRELGYLVEEL